MYLKKLLTSYYKYYTLTLATLLGGCINLLYYPKYINNLFYISKSYYKYYALALIMLLGGCLNVLYYPKYINNLFYINNVNEEYGMLLKNKMQSIFSNDNINTAKYIVNINISVTEALSLTNVKGFATRGTIYVTSTVVISNKENGQQLLRIANSFNEIYNVENNGFATAVNKRKAMEYIVDSMATTSITQINLFIKRNYETISQQVK